MENIKVALISKDKDYGRALGLALVEAHRNFTVTLFTGVPLHSELDRMDIVLSDTEEEYMVTGKNILLTEKYSQVDKNYEDRQFRLYKYSNVRSLAGEILFIYSFLTGRKAVPVRNVNAKVFVFGSYSGGSGCTSAAVTFARELKKSKDKKIIYISLEELESTNEFMKIGSEGKNLSDYLYYLFDNTEENRFPFLESYVISDPFGVEAFVPSPGRNVMRSLSSDEISYFVNAVLDTGGYDYMVIDAGCSLDKSILTCYEMANDIFMISRNCVSIKMEKFIQYLCFSKGEEVTNRVKDIILPDDPGSFSNQNDIKLISPEGSFGREIKKISATL